MLLAYSSGAPLVDLKSARAAVAEHGGSLLGGAWTLTIPSKGAQPIYVGVAALALLLLGGYGYRAVPTQAPRTNADVLAAAPAQAAGIIGDASINVARESKAGFWRHYLPKAAVKSLAKQIVASVPALAAPPVKRAAADTSSENGSPGTPRLSSTVLTSTAEKAPHQNSGIREQDIANLVLPAALPAQRAMKQEDSQQEKSPKEEPYEQRKIQPPVHVSDLSVEQEVDSSAAFW